MNETKKKMNKMNTIKKMVLAAVFAGMGLCSVLPAWAGKAKAMIDPLQSLSIGVGSTDACLSKCLSQVPAEQLEVRQKELDGLRNSIRGAMRTYPAQAQYLAIAGNAMMERVVAYDYTYHSQQTSALSHFFDHVVAAVNLANAAPSGICAAAAMVFKHYDCQEPENAKRLTDAFDVFATAVGEAGPVVVDEIGLMGTTLIDSTRRNFESANVINEAFSNVVESVGRVNQFRAQTLCAVGCSLLGDVARTPEANGQLLAAYSNVVESIRGRSAGQIQALGETGKGLLDAIARTPEANGHLVRAYSNVLESVVGSADAQALALGETGRGWLNAIARLPEAGSHFARAYSNVWEFVADSTDAKALALGAVGNGLMEAIARQPEQVDFLRQAYSNVVESVAGKTDAQAQAIGAVGEKLMDAIARQPEQGEMLCASFAQVTGAVSEITDARVLALGQVGASKIELEGSVPELSEKADQAFSYLAQAILKSTQTAAQAQAMGKIGARWMADLRYNSDGHDEYRRIVDEAEHRVRDCSDAQAQALGEIGAATMDAQWRNVGNSSISKVLQMLLDSSMYKDCPDAEAEAWGKIGTAAMTAISRRPAFAEEACLKYLESMPKMFRKGCTDIAAAAVAEPLAAMMAAGENQSAGKALEQLKYPKEIFNLVRGLDDRRAMAVGKACAGAINAIAKTDGFALNYVQKPLDVLRQTAVSTPSRVAEGIGLAGYGVMSAFSADPSRFNIQMGLLDDNLSWITGESQMMRLVSVKSPRPEGVWDGTAEVVVELRWILDGVPYALDASLQAGGENGAKVYELASVTDGVYTQVMSRAELFGEASTVQYPAAYMTLQLVEQVPGRASEVVRKEYATFPFGNYLTLSVPTIEHTEHVIVANGVSVAGGTSGGAYTVSADAPISVVYQPAEGYRFASGDDTWTRAYSADEIKAAEIILMRDEVLAGIVGVEALPPSVTAQPFNVTSQRDNGSFIVFPPMDAELEEDECWVAMPLSMWAREEIYDWNTGRTYEQAFIDEAYDFVAGDEPVVAGSRSIESLRAIVSRFYGYETFVGNDPYQIYFGEANAIALLKCRRAKNGELMVLTVGLVDGLQEMANGEARPNELSTAVRTPYYAWNDEMRRIEGPFYARAMPLVEGTRTLRDGRWYVALSGKDKFQTLTVSGDAHLILEDGCDIDLLPRYEGKGIMPGLRLLTPTSPEDLTFSSISIYGQKEGTGKLSARGDAGAAGIGTGPGEYGQTTINIHGGQITAFGGKDGAAAIGTGVECRGFFYDDSSFPSTLAVNIYGGTVVANPERGSGGPGIGFGNRSTLPQVALKVLGGDVTCMCGPGERAFAIGWGWDCGLYRGDPYDCDYLRFALGRGMGLWAGKDSAEGTFLRFSPAAYDQMIRDHANLPYAHIMPAPPLSVDIASPDWRLFTYEVLTNGAPMEVAGRGDLHLDLPGVTEVEVVYTVADGYQIEDKQTWTKFIGVRDLEGESTFRVEPPMPTKSHVIVRQNFELVRNADSSFALKLSADDVSPLVDDERWIVITDAASATGLFDDIWADAEPMIGTRRTDEVMIGSWVEKVKALGGTIQCFEAADAVLHLDSTVGNLMVFRATRATGDGTIMTVGGERNLQTMTEGGDEVRTGSMDAEYIKPLLNAEVYGQRTNESDEYGYRIFDLLLGLKNETQPEGEVYFWVAFRRLDVSGIEGKERDVIDDRRATVRRIAASVMDMPVGRFEANLGSIYPRFENAERDFYAATGRIASLGEFPAMLPRDTEEVFVFRTRLGEKGEQDAKVVAIGDCAGITNDELRWVNRLAGATVTISYFAWDEAAGKVVEQPPVEAIPMPESEDSGEVVLHGNRWYVVVGNRHLNRDCLRVDVGTAHLILADGASLEARGGVTVDQDATLAIYSEKEVSHDQDRYKQSRMTISSTDGWAGRRDEPGVFGGALEIHGGCFEGYGGKAATIRNRRLTFYGGDLWIDGCEVGGSVISSRAVDIRGGYFEAHASYREGYGYVGGYPLNVFAGEQDGFRCELNVGLGAFVTLRHEGVGSLAGSSAIADTLDVNLADGMYVWSGDRNSELQLTSLPIYRARPKRYLAFNPSMEKLREQDFEIMAAYDDNLKTNGFTLTLPAEELRPGEKWCVVGFDESISRLTADEYGGVSVGDALMLEFATVVSVEAPIVGDEAFARRIMDEGISGFKGCFTALTDESTIAIPSDKAVDLVLVARVIDSLDLPLVTMGAAKELQSMADGETAGCGLEFLQKQEFTLSRNADGSFTLTLPEGDVLKPGESWAWVTMPVGVGDDDEVVEMLTRQLGAGVPAGVLSFDMFMDEEASGEILACGATTERTITLPAGAAAVLVGRTRPGVSMVDGPCEYLALSFGMASHLNVPGYKDWPRHDELFPNASDYCTVTIPEVDKAALIIAVDGTELGYRPDGVYTVRKGSNVRIEVLLADPENYELRSPAVLAYDYIQNDVTVGPGDVVVVAKSAPTPVADQGFVVRRGEDGALTVDMSGEAPLGPGELWVCLTIDKGGCDLPDMESEGGLFGDIIWRDSLGVLDDVNAGELPLDLFMVVPGAEGVVVSTNETFAIPSDSEMALVARAYDGYNGMVGGNRYYGLSMGGVRFLTTLQPGDEVEGERWNEEHQVRYSAWDGEKIVHGLVTNALPLTAAAFDANGILSVTSNCFYAVTGKVRGESTRLGIDVAEGVTLSLLVKDGSRLELGFIHLPPTSTLNVYGQDNGSGTLTFPSASMNRAAIGGALGDAGCGTINFHGPQLTIGSLFLSQEKGIQLTDGKIQVDAYAVIGGNLNRDTESSGALNVYRGIVDVMGQAGCAIGGYKPMQVNVRGGKITVRDGAIGGMNMSSRASGITLGAGYKLQCQREEETVELTVAEYDKLLADGNPPSGVRIVRPATVAFDAEIAQLALAGKLTMMVRAAGGSKAGLKTVEPIWTAEGGTYPIECGDGVYVIAHANGTESIRRPDVMTFGIATGDVAVAFADLNWHEPELVAEQKFEAYRCLDGRVRLTPKGRLAEGEAWLWIALPDYVATQSAMGGFTIAEMFAQQLKGAVDSKICYVGGVRDNGVGPVVEPMLRPLYNCVQGNMFLPTDGFHWGVSREKKVFYAPADTEFAAVCKVYDAGIAQMMFASDKQSAPVEAAEAAEAAAEAAEAESQPMLKAVAAVGAQAASAGGLNVNKDLFLSVGCRYMAQTAGSVQNLQALPRLPEYEPGDERNPWPLGPEDAEEPVAYTNDTNTIVIEGKGPFAEPTKKPWLEEGVGPITEIVIKNPETELPDDIFEGLGTPEPIGVDLPDGWPADDLPVPGQPWHGGYVKIEEGHWPLTISNVKFQQRYPWNGLVDITFDLTGSTNVELGVWAKSGSTTIAASNFVGRTDMMFAVESQKTVKLVWDADKDALPGDLTKLVLENVTITVGTGRATGGGDCSENARLIYSGSHELGMKAFRCQVGTSGIADGDELILKLEMSPITAMFGLKERCVFLEDSKRNHELSLADADIANFDKGDGYYSIDLSGRMINGEILLSGNGVLIKEVLLGNLTGGVTVAVAAESAAGLIDLAKGTRVARDIENIVIDPKWGEAATASVLWPKAEAPRTYDAATIEQWNTARLPAGQYEFAYTAGSTNYTAAFWLAADNWTVIDHETITGERPVTGEKVLVAGESVIKQGGKLVIAGEPEIIWDGAFKVEKGGRIYAPYFDVVVDPATGLVTLVPKDRPTVTGLRFSQRYPWNGLVDVFFTATYAKDPAAKVWVKLAAKLDGEEKAVKTLYLANDAATTNTQFQVAQGEVHLIWDTMKDVGLENYGELEITAQASLIRMAEEPAGPDEDGKILCLTARGGSVSVSVSNPLYSLAGYVPDLEISKDGTTWVKYPLANNHVAIPLSAGESVYFRGSNPNGWNPADLVLIAKESGAKDPSEVAIRFRVNPTVPGATVEASGSVMSLIDGTGDATEIPDTYCFAYLFYDCAALTKAPKLTATTLKTGCYHLIFDRTAVDRITMLGNGSAKIIQSTIKDLFGGKSLPENGTLVLNSVLKDNLETVTVAEKVLSAYAPGWTIAYEDAEEEPSGDAPEPLCFTARKSDGTFYVDCPKDLVPNLEVSTDGVKWMAYKAGEMIKCTAENCIYVRGVNLKGLTTNPDASVIFRLMECTWDVSGDVMSLIDYRKKVTTIPCAYCFRHLFEKSRILSAPTLSATTLTAYCYEGMFVGTLLSESPALTAQVLPAGAYAAMFAACSDLTRIRIGCSKVQSPEAFSDWLTDASSSGTIIAADAMTGTMLDKYGAVPNGWQVVMPATPKKEDKEKAEAK